MLHWFRYPVMSYPVKSNCHITIVCIIFSNTGSHSDPEITGGTRKVVKKKRKKQKPKLQHRHTAYPMYEPQNLPKWEPKPWKWDTWYPWWRHQMETFSALLAICGGNSPVPTQRPVTRSFDVYFDLRPNKRWTIVRLLIWDAIAPMMTSS